MIVDGLCDFCSKVSKYFDLLIIFFVFLILIYRGLFLGLIIYWVYIINDCVIFLIYELFG